MSWMPYRVVFRLCSPLHVGWKKTGNLKMTRGYVTGRILWAALTARLTRDHGKGADRESYVEIGEKLKEFFRFGYFYPGLPKNLGRKVKTAKDLDVHYPWKDKFFDYRFKGSYASTALDYSFRSALDGSLHETEYLRTYTRPINAPTLPVYLMGEIYVEKSANNEEILKNWEDALDRLQLGAERRYGWGKVELVSCCSLDAKSDHNPEMTLDKGEAIAAHALGDNLSEFLSGQVEPLVGWERANHVPGMTWALHEPIICYAPGSRLIKKMKFNIMPFGQFLPAG